MMQYSRWFVTIAPLGSSVSLRLLPKQLDEKVARLHLDKIGVKLTRLSDKQSTYIGIPAEGPFKSDHYQGAALVAAPWCHRGRPRGAPLRKQP
jgi:hypothetical protein